VINKELEEALPGWTAWLTPIEEKGRSTETLAPIDEKWNV